MPLKLAWIACLLIGIGNLIISGVDGGFVGILTFLICLVTCIITCDRVWGRP